MMDDAFPSIPPAGSGLSMNSNGGLYCNGHSYTADKKWHLICEYKKLKADRGGASVSQRDVATALKIGKTYAATIIKEAESGAFVNPDHSKATNRVGGGHGSKTLSIDDETILLQIRILDPTTQLKDYRRLLLQSTGTDVSESVLCRWFQTHFPYSASLRKPSLVLVPRDKFKPENIILCTGILVECTDTI